MGIDAGLGSGAAAEDDADFDAFLAALPKTELHVHLEGAIAPGTALELARRNGAELPRDTVEGLREWFRFRDFDHFIRVYIAITRCLRTADDYELVVVEFARDLARQNVRRAETTFSPGTHEMFGVRRETFLEGLRRGRRRAREEFGVAIDWIFDIVRNAPDAARWADYTLETALGARADGVVALGLGGKEEGFPCEPFAPWFERAREAGLHSAPHAGEFGGAAGVRAAVERLGAERIGHGIGAIEDPGVVRLLVERGVALEVCPTSNALLGAAPADAHPLRRLKGAGVRLTLGSDDPALFGTSLSDELALARRRHGFTREEIAETMALAAEVSFARA